MGIVDRCGKKWWRRRCTPTISETASYIYTNYTRQYRMSIGHIVLAHEIVLNLKLLKNL